MVHNSGSERFRWHLCASTVWLHLSDTFDTISMATDIYYDCSLPVEEVAEYNHIYSSYWGKNVDIDFIYNQEVLRVLPFLLQYRHDPYMFHQVSLCFVTAFVVSHHKANQRRFTIKDPVSGVSTTHSLLTYWLRLITNELNKYSTMPVHTYKEDDLYALMLERMARDSCGYVSQNGIIVIANNVQLHSTPTYQQ